MSNSTPLEAQDPVLDENHFYQQPDEFSLTKVGKNGQDMYVLSFIDRRFVPVIVGDSHTVKLERVIRSTIEVSPYMVSRLAEIVAGIEATASASGAVSAGT